MSDQPDVVAQAVDAEIDSMSRALQEANAAYTGNQFNLHAYWRHMAKAAINHVLGGRPEREGRP